jgi:flavin-dependent dehydrogenase
VTGKRVKGIIGRNDEKVVATEDAKLRGKSVVNASGRWSELQPRTELPGKRLLGLKQHFFEEDAPNLTDLYFFPGGYCGVQSVGAEKVNVCALVDASAANTLNTVFTRSKPLFERAIRWQPASESFATAPIFFAAPQPVTGDMINVGDAAAFIDPFLGDGISIALQTGVLAGECALEQDGQNTYQREYVRRVAPALRRAARLRQWLASPLAWKAMRIPGVISLAARSTRVAIR